MNVAILLIVLIIIIAIVFIVYKNGKMGGKDPIIDQELDEFCKQLDNVDFRARLFLYASSIDSYEDDINKALYESWNLFVRYVIAGNQGAEHFNKAITIKDMPSEIKLDSYIKLAPNFLSLSNLKQFDYLEEKYNKDDIKYFSSLIQRTMQVKGSTFGGAILNFGTKFIHSSEISKRNLACIFLLSLGYQKIKDITVTIQECYRKKKYVPAMESILAQWFYLFNNVVLPSDKLMLSGYRTKPALRTQPDDDQTASEAQ